MKVKPAKVNFELWKSGIKEPFEIHIQPLERIALYRTRAKLVRVWNVLLRMVKAGIKKAF